MSTEKLIRDDMIHTRLASDADERQNKSEVAPATGSAPFYVASKVKHAPEWRALRDAGWNVIATWIDEAGEGQSDYYELSIRCLKEISAAEFVLLYAETEDILKGALIEAGAALALGKQVRMVGSFRNFSRVFYQHPLVTRYATVPSALCARND